MSTIQLAEKHPTFDMSDAHFNIGISEKRKKKYDAIVVGSGISGGVGCQRTV